ncbi:MAG: type II toxin-antitoxin system PemK/MazF family toxin [Dysgonamonadaceae bacterium]|nr:type II toxin-antitoxin system PemK/MazF family toxin [Dysgonamonadaceae bacterium]
MDGRVLQRLLKEINYFTGKTYSNIGNYDDKYLEWISEVATKNRVIHFEKTTKSNEVERIGRHRGKVFHMDFGINIGCEFNFPHFCVVIKEFDYTAVIVPLSTIKEDDPEWKSPENLIIEIGAIENLPKEKKTCYALVNQIRTVSKKRLDYYRDEGIYYKYLKLTSDQLDLIDEQVIKLCGSIYIKK